MARPSHLAWLAVAGIVTASAVARFAVSTGVAAPWIAPDEVIYALLGRSLYEHGTLSILGGATPFFSFVYPAVIGAPLALLGPAAGVTAVQALQAVVMSLAAAVSFAWARTVASDGWALAAAALTVAIPGLAYSGLLMTEAVFYPVATLALWLLSRMLARPTLGRQAAFWAAAAVAVGTRLQAVLLVPAALLAVALAALLARRRELVRAAAPTLALAALVLVAGLVGAGAVRDVLGAYSGAFRAGYDAGDAATHVVQHVGALFLVVAGIPLVALVALTADALRRSDISAELAALLATALSWSALLVVQVGVFASRFVDHLAERDLLTGAPPLFVVLAAWLGRGCPRPQPATAIAALAIASPALLLSVHEVATREASLDSFSTIPLRLLAEAGSETMLDAVWAIAAACAVILAVLLPARARIVLPLAAGAVLVSLSAVASGEVRDLSASDRRWWFADASPSWIDEAASGPVLLLQASPNWGGVWKQAFWNERIDAVARVPGGVVSGPIPSTLVSPRFDGLLLDPSGGRVERALLVAPTEITLLGEPVTGYGPSADLRGLQLWRIDPPARISTWSTGVKPNGDLLGTAQVTVYDCSPGALELTLLGKQGTPVRFRVDGEPAGEVTVRPGAVWRGSLDAPAGATKCVFELESPGLTGSTRIDYVRR